MPRRETIPRRGAIGLTAVAALATLVVSSVAARATTIDTCLARKLTLVGRLVAARASCYARDAARPSPGTLATCLSKASDRFSGGAEPSNGQFARLERRSQCLTEGDQAAFAAAIGSYGEELDVQIGNPGRASRCDATKLGCVGRYVAGMSACLARAAKSTGVVDDRCVAAQTTRLTGDVSGCIHKAETRGDCSATGDAAALAAAADQFVVEALCALDAGGTPGCAGIPTPTAPPATPTPLATRTPTPVPSPGGADPAQACVDTINAYRASIGRPPYERWTTAETCANGQGLADSRSGVPHSAFGQCGEWAQNECPGWPGPPGNMIGACLQMMWNEGPGQDFATHGHYINMSSTQYTKVACGFAVLPNGSVWAVQDFR